MKQDEQKRLELRQKYPTLARLDQHFPDQFDPIVSTLKGHLLIEEQLDNFIVARLSNPSALKETRLTFDLKIKFAHALDDANSVEIWRALNKLNKLRNSLAHRLEDSKVGGLIEEFVEATKSAGWSRPPTLSSEESFGPSIYYLVAYLAHRPKPSP